MIRIRKSADHGWGERELQLDHGHDAEVLVFDLAP